tara:strand:- start:2149 stop:2457 length:309 start_codon:yes stop_codon:yes gene_type:complete
MNWNKIIEDLDYKIDYMSESKMMHNRYWVSRANRIIRKIHKHKSRPVSLAERQRILDSIHTSFVVGNYPTSANDQIMKDLSRLIRDTEQEIFENNLKKIKND